MDIVGLVWYVGVGGVCYWEIGVSWFWLCCSGGGLWLVCFVGYGGGVCVYVYCYW